MDEKYDHDSHVARDRASRFWFFILTMTAAVGLPTLLGMALGNAFGFHGGRYLFGTFGFGFGLFVVIKLFPRYWVIVPQTAAFVTTNQLAPAGGNPNIPYGPGGHFCFPWELRAESGNITLDTLTLSYDEEVPTATSTVTVHGSLQFKFLLTKIQRVVELDVSTIERGFLDMVHEFLSEFFSEMQGEDAKNHVKEVRERLEEYLKQERAEVILTRFGARVEGVQISSIDLPPKVQEVRDALEEARTVSKAIWQMLGFSSKRTFDKARKDGKVTEEQVNRAREQFLVASGNVPMSIQRIDATGLENARIGGAIVAGAGLTTTKKEK